MRRGGARVGSRAGWKKGGVMRRRVVEWEVELMGRNVERGEARLEMRVTNA